ncbi:MAG: hypothetical protein AABW79_00855 [Nanoarchaeota archaeon]
MGKQIHLRKVEALFDKSPVVDFKSIERIVNQRKKGNYAKLLVSNLLKRKAIRKVGKGVYTKFSESSLSVFAFAPAYLGLQSSLSHYGVWEQETIPLILTTKKVRVGIRKIMDSNVLVRRIDEKHFFGFEFLKEGNFYIPYSDLEKTLIDMVVFNQRIDEETFKEIKRRIDKKKLFAYLEKYSSRTRKIIKEKLRR